MRPSGRPAPHRRASRLQRGAALIEGLISLLLFAFGLWHLDISPARLAGGTAALGRFALLMVPPDPLGSITRALADPQVAGGCFRLKFPRRQWIYRVSDRLGNVAVDLFQIALGDHGIFCRREAFVQAGGYPDVPLMEDAGLYRRLRRGGNRMRQLPAYIVSSPRRYEQLGPVRTTAYYLVILLLYLAKVSPENLLKVYRMLTRAKDRVAGSSSPRGS